MVQRSGEDEEAVLLVGLGFIGRHVARGLADQGCSVTALTRSTPGVPPAGVRLIVGDAGDAKVVDAALRGVGAVVFCAGGLLPADSVERPADDAKGVLGPLRTTLECARDRVSHLIYLSSGGTVYGRPRRLPVVERHPLRPIVPYGRSRADAELLIATTAGKAGIATSVLRLGNVYGLGQPADRGQGVVAAFLDAAMRGTPAVLYGDGSIIRDYVAVEDVAEAVVAALGVLGGVGVVNVGSGVGLSLCELGDLVRKVTGRRLLLEHRPHRPYDVERIVLDISRLRARLGVEPVPPAEGIRRLWAAQQQEEDRAEAAL